MDINCGHCNGKVSKYAENCRHCGGDLPQKYLRKKASIESELSYRIKERKEDKDQWVAVAAVTMFIGFIGVFMVLTTDSGADKWQSDDAWFAYVFFGFSLIMLAIAFISGRCHKSKYSCLNEKYREACKELQDFNKNYAPDADAVNIMSEARSRQNDTLDILKQRLAKGEITLDDFRGIKKELDNANSM